MSDLNKALRDAEAQASRAVDARAAADKAEAAALEARDEVRRLRMVDAEARANVAEAVMDKARGAMNAVVDEYQKAKAFYEAIRAEADGYAKHVPRPFAHIRTEDGLFVRAVDPPPDQLTRARSVKGADGKTYDHVGEDEAGEWVYRRTA